MYHLSKKTIIGLCYRTLPEKPMLDATAHLSWCTSCRQQAESLGASLSRFDTWQTPPLPEPTIEKAVVAARAQREQNIWWRKVLREVGVSKGASARALRIAITSACLLSLFVVGLAALFADLAEGKKVKDQLIIHAPATLLTGSTAVIAVELRSEDDSVANIPVDLQLSCSANANSPAMWWTPSAPKESGKTLSLNQKTNADGVALFSIKVPVMRDAFSCSGTASASLNGSERRQFFNAQLRRELTLHLSSDKPTYQPGQIIHVRGLAIEKGSSLPLANSPVRIEFFDEGGTRLSRNEGAISAQGIFSAELELSPEAALGTYRAVLSVERSKTELSFKVERYSLPPFEVSVKPLVPSTNGSEAFGVEVSATYSFGEPVPSGKVRLFVSYAGSSVSTLEAPLKNGVATLTVSGAKWIEERAKYEGGVLSLRATVIDPAARAEEGRSSVVVTRDSLLVDLHSEARSLRMDLPAANKILIRTSRPDGSAVSAKVQVLSVGAGEEAIVGKGELIGELETDQDGIGFLDLPPAFFGRQLAALVTDPKDNHQLWKVFPAPPVRSGSSIIRCDQALLRAGQTISCDVYHASGRAVFVRATIHDIPVATTLTKRESGISQVKLALPTGVSGLLRMEIEGADAQDATYALVAPEEGLRVSIAGNVPKKPGEEATLALRVTNDLGEPRVAAIGLALVDAAVFSRAGGVSPRQIIETIFASPGLAPELMALLFPTEELGKEGSQGLWTSQQQINARWLLSGVYGSFTPILARSSLTDDVYKLESAKYEAKRFFDDSFDFMMWILGATILIALMSYSFTFRAVMLGALFGIPALVASGFFFDEFLDFKRDMVQLIAVFTGFTVFIFTIWWSFKNRPDPLLSTNKNTNSQKLLWAAGGVAALFIGLIFVPVFSRQYDAKSSMQSPTVWGGAITAEKSAEPPAPPMVMAPEPAVAIQEEAPRADPSPAQPADLEREGGAGKGKPKEPDADAGLRVREDFPETLYYNAGIVTDESGHAEVRFQVADSITTWRVYGFASDARGFFGALEGGLEVFQDFFVDLDMPRDATVGDEFAMQVAIHNYQKDAITVSLRATADEGLTVNPATLATPIEVKPGAVAGVLLPAKLSASGALSLTITGETATSADAVKRIVRVAPNGRETRQIFSGLALDTVNRKLGIPENALLDGRKIELTFFASSLALALDGIDGLLAEPHGCFEQVSSVTYPNALILKALKATGKSDPEIEARALRFLRLGYQQLLPYEVPGGGFSYFGGSTQVPHLTAYALAEFTEMSTLIEVDSELLMRTQMALVNFFAQSDSFGGPAQAGYITLAMVESDPNWNQKEDPTKPWDSRVRQTRETTKKAMARLSKSFSVTDSLDTYALALAANAFFAAGEPEYHKEGMRLLDVIQSRAEPLTIEGSAGGVRYSTRGASLYGSYGAASSVETTALVARAFLLSGERADKAKGPLRALLSMRDSYSGTFYSTQGTILSLRALLAAAQTESGATTIKVLVDGQESESITFDAKNAYTAKTIDLSDSKADALITIDATGASAFSSDISYRLWVRYYTPWEQPAMPSIETIGESDPTLALKVSLDKTNFKLGEIGTATATLSRDGGTSTRGMILVELGLPPGFRLTPEAMQSLEAYPVKRVEQRARGVVLYLEDPGAGANLTFKMPIVAVRGVTKVLFPRSRAYFYYQPWIESLVKPIQLNVSPK